MAFVSSVVACTTSSTTNDDDNPDPADSGASSSSGEVASSSGEASSSGSPGAPEDRGEWTDYDPAEISGEEDGEFASAEDIKKFTLPATDIGGGLLKVTIAQPAVDVSLWLRQGEKADEARWEGHFIEADDAPGTFYLRLHGNTSYELEVRPLDFQEDEANPYTVSWQYEALIDGYEANDERGQAKRIPVDTSLSAYLHNGVGPNDSRLVGSVVNDWYKFELTEAKTVHVAFKRGAEQPSFAALSDADGERVQCASGNGELLTDAAQTGLELETCKAELAAGNYFVQVGVANPDYPGTIIGEELPAHFKDNYSFTVVTE